MLLALWLRHRAVVLPLMIFKKYELENSINMYNRGFIAHNKVYYASLLKAWVYIAQWKLPI